MGAEGAEGFEPSKKEVEGENPEDKKSKNKPRERQSRENTRRKHPTARSITDRWIEEADNNLRALGVDVPPQEEIDEGIDDIEQFLAEQPKSSELKYSEKLHYPIISGEPGELVMHDADYHSRDLAIAEMVKRLEDEPEDAELEDLDIILDGEIKDLAGKREKLGGTISGFQEEWLKVELEFVKSAKEAVEIMLKGGKIADEDPRIMDLDVYLRDKLELYKKLKEDKKDNPELQVMAGRIHDILEVLFEKETDYEPPKKKS